MAKAHETKPTATSTAHTPKPWKVCNPFGFGSNLAVVAKSKGIVCQIANRFTGDHSEVDPEESEANARLIAAAPSLAEALETLLDVFLDGRMDDLSEKEEQAYAKASVALDAAYGVPRIAA